MPDPSFHGLCIGGPYAGQRIAAQGSVFTVASMPPSRITLNQFPDHPTTEPVNHDLMRYHFGTIKTEDGQAIPIWTAEGVCAIQTLLSHYENSPRS